jgi:hypothetical protein
MGTHQMPKTCVRRKVGGGLQRSAWQRGVPVAAVLSMALGLACPSSAAIFVCATGDVPCLIAAINTANANGEANTITLAAGTYLLTEVNNVTAAVARAVGTQTAVDAPTAGANGLPPITGIVTITGMGPWATILERQATAPPFRLVQVMGNGQLTLDGLTLRGGYAADFSGERGGAIYNEEGMVTVLNSRIVGNAADRFGGGIDNFGTLTIRQSTIADNWAGEVAGGIDNNFGTVLIAQSTIADNSAERTGGMYHALGTLTVNNSTFTSNVAQLFQGGAIFNDRSLLTMTSSTIAHNLAGLHGGGIYNEGGTLRLRHSTVASNTAEDLGGGLANVDGTVEVVATLVALNASGFGESPECVGAITSLGHNLISDLSGCTFILLASDLIGDPQLGDFTDDGMPGRGHIPLLPDSPAIDADNTAVCPPTDQLGQPRVGLCDIGAIEFQGHMADTIPPAIIIAASPATLWPPNGKSVSVTVSGTMTDEPGGSGVHPSSAAYVVLDEYRLIQPRGSLTLGADAYYTLTVALEASRRGNDCDGRHYTITVSAKDHAGNLGVASTIVTVPHEQGK